MGSGFGFSGASPDTIFLETALEGFAFWCEGLFFVGWRFVLSIFVVIVRDWGCLALFEIAP